MNLIASTVAEGATRAQLHMFLELAAKYDLDPFAKEIWCAVPRSKDGAPRTDKVLIMVGRDGFLKIAQRNPDFRGLDGDVVCEKDLFEVERTADDKRLIVHKYGIERGKIIGAYAIVFRANRHPTYYFAPIGEFRPDAPSVYSQWSKGPSSMILKCAEAAALRRAFSITGLVAEEEMGRALEVPDVEALAANAPAELVTRVQSLFDQARLLDQDSYTPAKQRLMLAGASEERVREIENEVALFIEEHGGVILDAEVVAEVVEKASEQFSGATLGDDPTDVGKSADAPTEPAESLERDETKDPSPPADEPKDEPEAPATDPARAAAERAMRAHGFDPAEMEADVAAEIESPTDALPPEPDGLFPDEHGG